MKADCRDSEDCKGFVEAPVRKGSDKVKYLTRDSDKTMKVEDRRSFIKKGGATDLGEEVETLLSNPQEEVELEIENEPQ